MNIIHIDVLVAIVTPFAHGSHSENYDLAQKI